jgi:hypothetical protein
MNSDKPIQFWSRLTRNSLHVKIFRSNFFCKNFFIPSMPTQLLLSDIIILVIFSKLCGAMQERTNTCKLIQLSNFPFSWNVFIQTELILRMWCFCPGNSAPRNIRRISKSFVLVRRNFLEQKTKNHRKDIFLRKTEPQWMGMSQMSIKTIYILTVLQICSPSTHGSTWLVISSGELSSLCY